MPDYSAAELRQALQQAGVRRGQTLYCHSNIGFFGQANGVASRDALCQLFLDALMDTLGPQGLLLVPTYTYSFSNSQVFDVANSASRMGMLAEWVRLHPQAQRAHDPFYSVAALGQGAARFVADLPPNSFAPDSLFDRLLQSDGQVLCLNHPGCTLLHHVERLLQVPYRFDKTFSGQRIVDGQTQTLDWTIWVRYLSDDKLAHDPAPFVHAIKRGGVARWCSLGRGEVLGIAARDVLSTVREALPQSPWLLTAAHGAALPPHIDCAAT